MPTGTDEQKPNKSLLSLAKDQERAAPQDRKLLHNNCPTLAKRTEESRIHPHPHQEVKRCSCIPTGWCQRGLGGEPALLSLPASNLSLESLKTRGESGCLPSLGRHGLSPPPDRGFVRGGLVESQDLHHGPAGTRSPFPLPCGSRWGEVTKHFYLFPPGSF